MEWLTGEINMSWLDFLFGVWFGYLLHRTFEKRKDGRPLGVGTLSEMLKKFRTQLRRK